MGVSGIKLLLNIRTINATGDLFHICHNRRLCIGVGWFAQSP